MSLSIELQIGKAGEYLVCSDLITKGYSAFLSDQGLPYDVLVDIKGTIKRIQVKTISKSGDHGISKNVYRFSLRTGNASRGQHRKMRLIHKSAFDYVAFVFLDKRIVQYISVAELTTDKGFLKQCLDFRESGNTNYIIGKYSNL